MIFLDATVDLLPTNQRIAWEQRPEVEVGGSESWLRGTIRTVSVVRDEQGFVFPLRDQQVLVNVAPSKTAPQWRAEAEAIGAVVVGRGTTPNEALADWRKRFRATVHRFLEMRPFEMTAADKASWDRIQSVIDVPLYKANKPLSVLQTGVVLRVRGDLVRVRWADGAKEWVKSGKFDEVFSRFTTGQPFEAVVTRHPTSFRLLRAEAVRRLPSVDVDARQRSKSLWDRLAGEVVVEPTAPGVDEEFWLKPPG